MPKNLPDHWSGAVPGKLFGHDKRSPVENLVFASPTGYIITSSGFPIINWVYSIDSSEMVGLELQPVISQTKPVRL